MEEENKEVNEIKEQAVSAGWKPKEEFEGPEDAFIDYPEFVRRGELFDAIKKSNKDVKDLRKALNDLSDFHNKTLEAEHKNNLEQLKQAKIAAIKEGEAEKVVAIDEQIAEVKTAQKENTTKKVETPVFDEWVKENKWYNEDAKLRAFANGMVQELKEGDPSISIEDVFEKITEEVKQTFPAKFQKKTTKALPSGNNLNRSNGGGSIEYSDLSPAEKTMHDRFVRLGVITSQKYIESIKAQRQQQRN